jgi:hypothetical protein
MCLESVKVGFGGLDSFQDFRVPRRGLLAADDQYVFRRVSVRDEFNLFSSVEGAKPG